MKHLLPMEPLTGFIVGLVLLAAAMASVEKEISKTLTTLRFVAVLAVIFLVVGALKFVFTGISEFTTGAYETVTASFSDDKKSNSIPIRKRAWEDAEIIGYTSVISPSI